MPRKVDAKTDWRPIDIMGAGRTILDELPERQIWDYLVASLPNGDVLADRSIAAFAVVQEALIVFVKARIDHQGRPRVSTVKANLRRVEDALKEIRAATAVLDLRSLSLLREAAGAKRLEIGDYNRAPLNESPIAADSFTRGHHRLRLINQALADMQGWLADAIREVPLKDERADNEPGLRYFAERIAHVWEFYGGVRFNASTKRGGGADFVHGLLRSAGIDVSLPSVTKATRAAVKELDREHPERIIVAPQDHHLSLGELAAHRGPVPKKGKVSAKR